MAKETLLLFPEWHQYSYLTFNSLSNSLFKLSETEEILFTDDLTEMEKVKRGLNSSQPEVENVAEAETD